MKQELVDRIYQAAPKLYHNEPNPVNVEDFSPRAIARHYGPAYLGVADGWFQILMDLSIALEAMEGVSDVRVTQVKEKYGGLRFYVNSATEEMYTAINLAEILSEQTCEVCGTPGKPRTGGWINTLCDEHHDNK